eukprot:2847917-Amphidinium_carterae.1
MQFSAAVGQCGEARQLYGSEKRHSAHCREALRQKHLHPAHLRATSSPAHLRPPSLCSPTGRRAGWVGNRS